MELRLLPSNATAKVAQIKPSAVESAKGTGQRLNSAASMDVRSNLNREEFVLSTEQNSSNVVL